MKYLFLPFILARERIIAVIKLNVLCYEAKGKPGNPSAIERPKQVIPAKGDNTTAELISFYNPSTLLFAPTRKHAPHKNTVQRHPEACR